MPDSSLIVQEVGPVAVVTFRDNSILDVVTIQRIGRELYELVEQQNRKSIVLDFDSVRFLSSQALGVLLTLRRKAEKTGATVVLARLRAELARVFKITNLDKMFDFYDTIEKSLDRFGVKPPPAQPS